MNFIPEGYARESREGFSVFHSPDEPAEGLALVVSGFREALRLFDRVYSIDPSYGLDLCVFHSRENAASALHREVPDTALLVPFADARSATIACLSPLVDSRNGDAQRMRRHFIHELAHVAISLETGVGRELGMGKAGLPLPEWQDEGLSEYLSFLCLGSIDRIEMAIRYYRSHEGRPESGLFEPRVQGEPAIDGYMYATGKVALMLEGQSLKGESVIRLALRLWNHPIGRVAQRPV